MKKLLSLSALLVLACAMAIADQPRPMQPQDYYRFEFISDAQMAPDGRHVAFIRAKVDEKRRSRDSAIWLVPADGSSDPAPFTAGDSDSRPRWSPDGTRLAFLRRSDDGNQIYLIPTDGGEARAVTDIRQGSISDFFWLPDGKRLVLTLNIDPAVEDPTKKKEDKEEPEANVQIFSRQVYKSEGTGYLDERRRTLWLLDIASGDLEHLIGDPEWHVHNPAASPTGELIAFNADFSGGEFDGGFNQDLHLLDLGSGQSRRLPTPDGRASSPVFAPDGQAIAFLHQADHYEPVRLKRIVISDGQIDTLHDGMALTVSSVVWPNGLARPLVGADDRGSRPLFTISTDGSVEPVAGTGASIGQVSASDKGELAWTENSATRLDEVFLMASGSSQPQRLTGFNDALLDEIYLAEPEQFSFVNDDTGIDGFLVRPKGFDDEDSSKGPWPLILNIKGGPAGMWGHQWMHEFQIMAGAGYAVAFTNYRGSTGYGHAFQSAVRLDYGGVDYRDNMALVDEVLARFDWIDPDRLLVTGGSHGGFLTNWITTQTDRFAAAVTQRSVSNWISEAGTQSYPPARMNAEFGGSLWENFELYWNRSPLKYADRVRTPTLIIHSTSDHITPIGQGQEWFYALLNNDVETELAMFEGEGHGLSRSGTPVNLVKRLELILAWFARHDPGA